MVEPLSEDDVIDCEELDLVGFPEKVVAVGRVKDVVEELKELCGCELMTLEIKCKYCQRVDKLFGGLK